MYPTEIPRKVNEIAREREKAREIVNDFTTMLPLCLYIVCCFSLIRFSDAGETEAHFDALAIQYNIVRIQLSFEHGI